MNHSLKNIAWREAATGGLYMGLVYAVLGIVGYVGRSHLVLASLINVLTFFAVGGLLYFYAYRMAIHYGSQGFSYGKSLGFILRMSMFAGVLAGVGMFILYNWIDPESIKNQIELQAATLVENGWDEKQVEEGSVLSLNLIKNPLAVVFIGVVQLLTYGGILGLVVSFFVKRPSSFTPSDNNISNPQ